MAKQTPKRRRVSQPAVIPDAGVILVTGFAQFIARSGFPIVALVLGLRFLDLLDGAGKWTALGVVIGSAFAGMASTPFGVLAGWGAAAVFGIVALVYRWLYHRQIAKDEGHTQALELRLDARRTSSGLTRDGHTHPDDGG